jgi:hypothetical protein
LFVCLFVFREAFEMDEVKGQAEIMPLDYQDWLQCLKRPDSWDVTGIIQDVRDNVRMDSTICRGKVLAVIDYLLESQSRDLNQQLVPACKVGF